MDVDFPAMFVDGACAGDSLVSVNGESAKEPETVDEPMATQAHCVYKEEGELSDDGELPHHDEKMHVLRRDGGSCENKMPGEGFLSFF